MMEDKQMHEHGLFKRIGAFSVNLENPRSAVRSLRYAVESMKRPHSSLFIYPEGRIVRFSTELFLKIGSALTFDSTRDTKSLNAFFENKLSNLLCELGEGAVHSQNQFQKL